MAVLAGLTLLLVAIGYLPTRSLGGEAALTAMLLACAVSFLGSAAGAVPVAMARAPGPEGLQLVASSMALRLFLVAALGTAGYWLVRPERRPFLVWLAISYLVLLIADTGFARAAFRRL